MTEVKTYYIDDVPFVPLADLLAANKQIEELREFTFELQERKDIVIKARDTKLERYEKALEEIRYARNNNPNKEMGDLLLYVNAVANEALGGE